MNKPKYGHKEDMYISNYVELLELGDKEGVESLVAEMRSLSGNIRNSLEDVIADAEMWLDSQEKELELA